MRAKVGNIRKAFFKKTLKNFQDIFSENIRNFFREKFWWLRPETAPGSPIYHYSQQRWSVPWHQHSLTTTLICSLIFQFFQRDEALTVNGNTHTHTRIPGSSNLNFKFYSCSRTAKYFALKRWKKRFTFCYELLFTSCSFKMINLRVVATSRVEVKNL